MSRRPRCLIALLVSIAVLFAACGNSGDDSATTTTTPSSGSSSSSNGSAHRNEFVKITGVPGVTDKEISFAVVGTKTNNILGNCILDCYLAGVKAYFDMRNDEGGIFKRKLVVSQVIDDELGANQVKSLDIISQKKVFGDFQAVLLGAGWGDLNDNGVPTYVWGIDGEKAANRQYIWPSTVIRCADCTVHSVPYIAKTIGATHVGILGYGDTANSKLCAESLRDSIELYSDDIGNPDVPYFRNDLSFNLPKGLSTDVSAMKKDHVDFIATCMDSNGMLELGEELHRQQMDEVVLYHPNSYDHAFMADHGDLFEGDYVGVQYLPSEADITGTAIVDFQKWMKKQKREPDDLSMAGWINASLAFEGLLAAGPNFDRAKVEAATNAISDFTAGGILQPIDWREAHTPYTQATRSVDQSDDCTTMVRVENGQFVMVPPKDKPFFCWPSNEKTWSEPTPTSFPA